jgi:hypothetical protein
MDSAIYIYIYIYYIYIYVTEVFRPGALGPNPGTDGSAPALWVSFLLLCFVSVFGGAFVAAHVAFFIMFRSILDASGTLLAAFGGFVAFCRIAFPPERKPTF